MILFDLIFISYFIIEFDDGALFGTYSSWMGRLIFDMGLIILAFDVLFFDGIDFLVDIKLVS